MRQLRMILLRHGEAEEAHGRTDRARALTRRGAQDVARLGEQLAREGFLPDLIVASDAVRTSETAHAVAKALDPRLAVHVDARLYLGGLQDIANALVEMGEEAATALVVGHNPGFSLAAQSLTEVRLELATAEAAEMTIEAETWDEAMELTGAWELVRVVKI